MLCSRANTSKVEYFFFSSNGGQYLADLGICFQVHADSVQDTLKFNLLRELYMHTYMTKRAFSYIWSTAALRQPSDEARLLLYPVYGSPLAAQCNPRVA